MDPESISSLLQTSLSALTWLDRYLKLSSSQVLSTLSLHKSNIDFDMFKKHFKIKTNKDMNKKIIEVFSYRNNLSQRRATAEETLLLMLMKHKFDVPNHLTLRQEKAVLDAVQNNPDYYVYRMQKDFKHYVKRLAEKQAKEMILLDHVAFNDNVIPL